MPRGLIVYFSQAGSTGRAAEAIAAGLRAADYLIDLLNIKDERPPDPGGYDLLGIGLPAYYYRPPFNVTDYIDILPDLDGLPAFVFVMHGTYRGDAGNHIRDALAKKGAREVGYHCCLGADRYLAYLKEGYLFSPDHPTTDDLADAETFGRQIAAHVAGEPYVRPESDPSPALMYRMERSLTNRWLANQVYSRLFRVDAAKCDACGICMKLCPTRNIAEEEEGRPVWSRDCLLCLTCEMKCPKDAITSPISWRLFRPTMIYNVRQASRDPSISHVRVDHSGGRTQRV